MTHGVRSRLPGGVMAFLIFFGASRARAEPESLRLRLFIQAPLMGANVAFDNSSRGRRTELHFGAAALAVDIRDLYTVEVGAAVLASPVGGETAISFSPEIWLRAGITPVLYRGGSEGESGWVAQLVSLIGYRSLARSAIVYEDYGLATEHVQAVALDIGAQATHFSASGFGLALRLLSGIIVPVAHSYDGWTGFVDYPPTRLRFAIPIALDLGCIF